MTILETKDVLLISRFTSNQDEMKMMKPEIRIQTHSEKTEKKRSINTMQASKIYKVCMPFLLNGRPNNLRIHHTKNRPEESNRAKKLWGKGRSPPFVMLNGLMTRITIFKPPYTNLLNQPVFRYNIYV